MYLLVRLLDVPVLLLVSINCFVHSLAPVLTFRKGQPNLSSCKVLFLFHSCYYYYCIFLNFNTHSPLHFEDNSMKTFKGVIFVIFYCIFLNFNTHSPPHFEDNSMKTFKGVIFVLFNGSVDAIVFSKTGNHLPQCLWFSNSFFTVDGCINCVRGILNS